MKRINLRSIRGLSTAELVGIIVVVGILGALGGTYIAGLVGQANTNALAQNVQSLNTVAASALAGGATLNSTSTAAAGQIRIDSVADCITDLNNGVTVGTVTYQMSPPISAKAMATLGTAASASYAFNPTPTATSTSVVFAVGTGATTP